MSGLLPIDAGAAGLQSPDPAAAASFLASPSPVASTSSSAASPAFISDVEIIPFSPEHRDAFRTLNLAWVATLFKVEPMDDFVLSNPESAILAPGGVILLARLEGEIVGTISLIHAGPGKFELSKMCVKDGLQGRGIGRQMMAAIIAEFKRLGGTYLFLESSTKLPGALSLYETVGFRHTPKPASEEVHYSRADVYMLWSENPTPLEKKGKTPAEAPIAQA